ncbi:uncharacterized protein FIESC28_09569 [Fusarium coffeatum]|uniref:Uncharacterized protein n=1 Tax=Fusarium coffeatum TaxID=231269 RepID=A0A366QZ59_9HYPO|nr:uncharacterized protein FIESC28_09569 [Fusarium coffeatum]RBR10183.1 hypothetical protein FIESC28_09569 [Fusarium coffeatum]
MEPIEENSVAVPVAGPPAMAMLDAKETHRFARYIKEYFTAGMNNAIQNTSDNFNKYFANSAYIPKETFELAIHVIESAPEGELGRAACDGCNWPYYWPKDSFALLQDIQRFNEGADALLNQGPPAGSVDPNLLTQPASEL